VLSLLLFIIIIITLLSLQPGELMVSRWAGRQIHYLASDGFPIVRMSLSLAGDSRQTHYLALAAVLLTVKSFS